MACLEQLHQRKRDDETDRGPFQASQKHVKHSTPILAQAPAALNWRKSGHSDGLVLRRAFEFNRPCFARGMLFIGVVGFEGTAVLTVFHAENRLPLKMR
jgi:hypothetical protein